ncbi:LamG domain-containing protein [Agromyces ramosus]|uniref:LamG domain-containing protein n=1 Tax=Agromyces ramosus TaxID=33879 RepID=UPI0027D8893F|nr:LamG domain-containing protein [Agromyces ramosus]
MQVKFKPRTDGSFRVVVGSPNYTGGAVDAAAAAALTGAADGDGGSFAAAHLAWWHAFWGGVSPMKITSTDGSGEYIENQRALGMYTTAATSRSTLPATHGGIANLLSAFQDASLWDAASYWHFNMRMQTSANFAANMADFNEPYFNLYHDNFETRQTLTAEKMPGSSGICVPEVMRFNGTGDYSATQRQCDSSAGFGYVTRILSTGPEAAYNMWLQYLYTDDEAFLDESYPFLAEVVRFYLWRAPVAVDGFRHIEHANARENQWDVTDPTTDLAAMRVLFPLVEELAAQRGEDDFADEIAAAIPQIPPFRTVIRNSKTVLAWSDTDGGSQNKENPDVEPVWPWGLYGDTGGADTTLARDTFTNRIYGQSYDWDMASTQAARVGLSDQVKTLLVDGTKKFQVFPNGFADYAGSAASAFYSEWQWVVASGVQEALVQSYDGLVRAPAAWPAGWDVDGALQIQGGHRVSVQVRGGVPTVVGIEAAKDDTITVRNPWAGQEIRVIDGSTGTQVVAPTTATTMTIPLTEGGSVVVERTADPLSGFTFAQVDGARALTAKHLGSRTIGLDPGAGVPAGGLVDWIPSSGSTVLDASGRHVDGAVQGGSASYFGGPTGPALVLDGTRYVSAPAPALGAMTSFTAETQVRIDSTGSQRRLIDYQSVGNNGSTGFMVDVNPSNQVRFAGGGRVVQTPVTLPTGQFVHLAVTLDASGLLRVYLNGAVAWSEQGAPAPIGAGSGLELRFGADQDGGSRLTGKMGRTRIHDRALTSLEIAADARSQVTFGAEACAAVVGDTTLVDWNPATGTQSQVIDTSGSRRDAHLHGNATYTQGIGGPALVLNGGRYLTSGTKVNFGPLTALTVQAQVRTDTAGGYRRLVDYQNVGGNGSTGFLIDLSPDNHVRFIGAGVSVITGAVVPTGAMVDLAVTLDAAGALTVYQNGVVSWTGSIAAQPFGGCASLPLRIGADQNGGSSLAGAVGRVRVWGRALSGAEITSNAATPSTEQCRPTIGPDPLVDWRPQSGTSVPDASGYYRPGTVLGTPTYTSDADGPALVLTGSQSIESVSKVNLGSNLTALTASAHVRVDSSGSYRRLVDYIPVGSGATGVLIDLTPDNHVRFIASGTQTVTGGAQVPTGVFVDLVVTLDTAGLLTVYQNGVSTWSGQRPALTNTCINLPLRVGRDQNGGSLLKAAVGQVRLWPRVLTAAEVGAL